MKRKSILLSSILLLASIVLSACIGLIPLETDEPAPGSYGPQITAKEHQTQTFDALWTLTKENYIYYETADVKWDSLRADYQAEINKGLTAEQFDELLKGLENDLPESSFIYQSRAERIEEDIADNSTYEGIGAFVGFNAEPEPHVILLSIIEGSPAEKAGLKAHDSIYAIDGSPVLLEEGIEAVQRVRGPAGTTVALTVLSPGKAKRIVEVKRGRLATNTQIQAYQIKGTNYGYILFPPIAYTSMLDDILNAMQTFATNQKLEGMILDLRIAGSSSNWPLEELLTLFSNGEIGDFYNRTAQQTITVQGQDVLGSQSMPLVVLVGRNTQGFPEILAGSLQEQKRAIVIGEATTGTIESSTTFLLPDGSRIFLQTTTFALSNGEQIGLDGIKPDIEIEAGWDDVLPNQDSVLDAAVKQLESK